MVTNRLNGDEPEKIATVMCNTLQHGGPDDAGIYRSNDNRLVFEHRRLSIIDLGANGHQPMADVTAEYWITTGIVVFNKVEKTFDDTV